MSNTRTFWIIWCSMWALGWLLLGFITFFLCWIFVPFSLLAILIPIGRNSGPATAPYPAVYPPVHQLPALPPGGAAMRPAPPRAPQPGQGQWWDAR